MKITDLNMGKHFYEKYSTRIFVYLKIVIVPEDTQRYPEDADAFCSYLNLLVTTNYLCNAAI